MQLPSIGQEFSPLTDALAGAENLREDQDAGVAAKEFEKLLATILVKELRRGLPNGFFADGPGRDVYEGWLDEHLGAALTEGRGLGLRLSLERSLRGPQDSAPVSANGEVQA